MRNKVKIEWIPKTRGHQLVEIAQKNLVGAKGNDSETQSKEDYNPSSEVYFKQMS